MNFQQLHHVSLVTADLERSAGFYRDVLGLREIPRPAFSTVGMWFERGPVQIHLIANAGGTYRSSRKVVTDDTHFALRVADFSEALQQLAASGYREDLPSDDPLCLVVRRTNVAGYPQAYVADPDGHIVEINAVA